MISILSPAKTLDFASPPQTLTFTEPPFPERSQELITILKEKTAEELAALMSISEKLADLNYQRFQDFEFPFSPDNAKQAILAFKGDVYKDLKLDRWNEEEFVFAQQHVRILSGLYGILRPLDLMQPYRLEMGTKLATPKGKNLYAFWADAIALELRKALALQNDRIVFNLASNEYFKSIDQKALNATIVKVDFLENKSGTYKIVSFYAKRARGTMTHWLVENKIDDPESAKDFAEDGYYFSKERSKNDHLVFLRG